MSRNLFFVSLVCGVMLGIGCAPPQLSNDGGHHGVGNNNSASNDCRLLTYEADNDGDGTADTRKTYTYDSNGNRLTYEEDNDGDGTVDARTTYTYDSNGNMLTSEFDNDADGTVDSRTTQTWSCDRF